MEEINDCYMELGIRGYFLQVMFNHQFCGEDVTSLQTKNAVKLAIKKGFFQIRCGICGSSIQLCLTKDSIEYCNKFLNLVI